MKEQVLSCRHTYIKLDIEKKAWTKLSYLFVFVYVLMPQYFGFEIAGFDMSMQRIGMVILLIYLLLKPQKFNGFITIIKQTGLVWPILCYFFVATYTMVFRTNINSLMYPLIEFTCFFLLIYCIKTVFTIEGFIKIMICCSYILCILGIIEYFMGRTPFAYMETLYGLYTGGMIRSGSYRIMSLCNHSLGYGLVLITLVPIACMDVKHNAVNVLQNKLLLLLLILNIILTGSRSTLAVFGVEFFILLFFNDKRNLKRVFLILFFVLILLIILLALFKNTGIGQYVLRMLASVLDELLGTNYAVIYGADARVLENSSNYRNYLTRIFGLGWLNPVIGQGLSYKIHVSFDGRYIKSIDNFYVAEYIRYAYPGLAAYLYYVISVIKKAWYQGINQGSGICLCVLAGVGSYFINLWWLDTLQSIKYVYILIAVLCCAGEVNRENKYTRENINAEDCFIRFRNRKWEQRL